MKTRSGKTYNNKPKKARKAKKRKIEKTSKPHPNTISETESTKNNVENNSVGPMWLPANELLIIIFKDLLIDTR